MVENKNDKVGEYLLLHRLLHYSTLGKKECVLAKLVSSAVFKSSGINVDHVSSQKNSVFTHTALMQAAYFGNLAGSKILLAQGAKLQQRDASGWSPLLWAICSGNVDFVKFIVNFVSAVELANHDSSHPSKRTSILDSTKYTLDDFLLYGCLQNSMQMVSLLKRIKRYSPELTRLLNKLAERKVAMTHHNSQDLFINIDLSHIAMDQFITLHQNNRLILKQALFNSPEHDFFLFHNEDCSNPNGQFTLPIPANVAALAARYEYLVTGIKGWKLFLTECLRDFERKMHQSDDLNEQLFWFGNICQLWVYVHNEQDVSQREEFEADLKEFANRKYQHVLKCICDALMEKLEHSLLKYYPFGNKNDKSVFDSLHKTPPLEGRSGRASYTGSVKTKVKRLLDKLHLFSPTMEERGEIVEEKRISIHAVNQSNGQTDIDDRSGPSRIIFLLESIYQSASMHFYPLNNIMHSDMVLRLLKASLTFINFACLKLILTQQSKYCDRLHGMAIRMNISEIESWLNDLFYEQDPKTFTWLVGSFSQLTSVCQYLQIYTCLDGDSAFEEFGRFCQIQQAAPEFVSFLNNFTPIGLDSLQLLTRWENVELTLDSLHDSKGRFLVSREILELFLN